MTRFPEIDASDVPWLTIDQMVEADRLAVDEFSITLLQMMEHAGAAMAEVVTALAPDGDVTILAGGGNNGGGGLCAARHLANRGRSVEIVLASHDYGPAVAHHLRTLSAMGIEPHAGLPQLDVVVDALVGYGLRGALHGRYAMLAEATQDAGFVASLDFPSGHRAPGAVDADVTVTLALPKVGLRDIRPLLVADLGLLRALWAKMGLAVGPIFRRHRIVEIRP